MIRRATAATLVFALQFGASLAPWVHAHADDHEDGDHHRGQVVHAHLPAHPAAHHDRHAPEGPAVVDASEEHATAVQALVAVRPPAVPTLAILGTVIDLAAPPLHAAVAPVLVASGHDPPLAASIAPRAPPLPPLS